MKSPRERPPASNQGPDISTGTGEDAASVLRRRDMEYLATLPRAVPAGRYLVHNHVRPTRRLGSRGFRAWLTTDPHRLLVCDCPWAPELGQHYRVDRDLAALGLS